MELYERIFTGTKHFNTFQNMELIRNARKLIPISVIEMKSGTIRVYYTIEELENYQTCSRS